MQLRGRGEQSSRPLQPGILTPSTLPALEAVGGDFVYMTGDVVAGTFPALRRIEGRWRFERADPALWCGPIVREGTIASGALTLGAGLRMVGGSFDRIPFASSTRLDAGAAVELTSNPSLCTSAIDAFLATQRAAGWTGPAVVGSNGGC